jgi:hypothetical protein
MLIIGGVPTTHALRIEFTAVDKGNKLISSPLTLDVFMTTFEGAGGIVRFTYCHVLLFEYVNGAT